MGGPGCTPLGTEQQQGRYSCLSSCASRALCASSESRFLGMECKVGGKFHVKINMSLRPVASSLVSQKLSHPCLRGSQRPDEKTLSTFPSLKKKKKKKKKKVLALIPLL